MLRSLALASALLWAAPPAGAALRPEEENTIAVFKSAAPSVVFVTNIAVRQDVYLDEFAIPQGSGSGFLWDREGHIVTNYHVVAGGNAFLVTLKDHTELPARLVGYEPRKDIAVLKVEARPEKLKPLPLGDSASLQVGQGTLAIGNPFGLDNTLTSGIVSALNRQVRSIGDVTIRDMIQTDAAINPGNSGGPLLDSSGNLIGMNMVIYSPSGASAGIGFAVPVNTIKRIVPQLIAYGHTVAPGIGITVLKDDIKARLLGDGDADIRFARGESHIFFEIDGRLLVSRMIDGQFPAYERVIPKSNDKRIEFERDRIQSAIRRVSLLSNERSRAVKFAIESGRVEIASHTPELGEAKEQLAVEYGGPAMTISFNAQYVLEFLNAVTTDVVAIEFKDEVSQTVMRPVGATDYDYTYVVMPMRI